jgi:hypothetical protein
LSVLLLEKNGHRRRDFAAGLSDYDARLALLVDLVSLS